MKVSVAYADSRQIWIQCEVPEGATLEETLARSGLLENVPELDLATHKVGIFGKVAKFDTVLSEGDRVEVYRPITADPETVTRRDE